MSHGMTVELSEEELAEALRRAEKNGRSLDEELLAILREGLERDDVEGDA